MRHGHPPLFAALERIKEEYARQVRAKVMARRRSPRTACPSRPIPDNSTPWLEHPRTYDDLLYISASARLLADTFQAWRVPSKRS